MIRYLSKAGKKKLGSTAMVRLDFNTEDTWRMQTAAPTLKFLIKQGYKVLVLSHKGRPRGIDRKLSLNKNAKKLSGFLGRDVKFIPHFNFGEIRNVLKKAKPESVFVLENIRFLKEEYENSPVLAKNLASLGDFYVNEGFPISHRKDASVSAITKFLPSYAGFQLEKEIKNLSSVTAHPKKPLVIILGGGKAHDKLGLLKFFRRRADYFLIGGEPANTLLWLKGVDVGKSAIDKKAKREFKKLLGDKKVILPIDYEIEKDRILDIGPKTIPTFISKIRQARTVMWNGPLGLFEKPGFGRGSYEVAKAIVANKRCFSLAGGGETMMFLRKHGFDKKFSFISTGGGAMLEFLAGEKLPGIVALEKSKK